MSSGKLSKKMNRIPSMYSIVKLSSTKNRSYTTDRGTLNSVRLWTNKDVVQWLKMNYFDKDIIRCFKKSKIDGSSLLTMTIDKLKSVYGVSKVGHQKRIMMLICSDTDDSSGHLKSKSNSSLNTMSCIISVLYHSTNDVSEGIVHRLFFEHMPTYRDFMQHVNRKLSNIRYVFYYDEDDRLTYVNSSESWYNYMEVRNRDSTIMLEISAHDYSLLDQMDAYILVTNDIDEVVYCNSKLRTIVPSKYTQLHYKDIFCSDTNMLMETVSISKVQTVPTVLSSDITVYMRIMTV